MKKSILSLAVATICCFNTARAQDAVINEIYFDEFVTFYLSSVDINTGATSINFFELELAPAPGVSSVRIEIEFKFQVRSEALGLDFDDLFLTVTTNPFDLTDAVRVRNTDLNTTTSSLQYVNGGSVNVTSKSFESIDIASLEAMQSIIMQSGRLPDGIYRVLLTVKEPGGGAIVSWSKDIVSSNPVSLELLSPGGVLADTAVTAINTTYPFFQWESDPCSICDYKIRVALYKPLEHSSMEDAIDDQTVLPLNQSEGFYNIGRATSFQYPTTGAVDLIPGGIYIWQINKVIPTTEGDQEISSFLYAFKIANPNAPSTAAGGGGAATSPIIQALQNSLGDEQFNALFGPGGDLENFVATGIFMLNGQRVQANDINQILSALQQGQGTVISVEVQ